MSETRDSDSSSECSASLSSSSVSLNELPNDEADEIDEKMAQMTLMEESKEPGLMGFITAATLLEEDDNRPKIKKAFLKGLIAAKKDLSHFQSIPRWPAESQVMPQTVKHIRATPGVPEVFYEVTGKETIPKVYGEKYGVVVYDYLPKSTVDYFSRSVAGPAKDLPRDPSAAPLTTMNKSPFPDTLKFESRFECGNLAKAIRITEVYYELYLRPDYYTSGHRQWFYFQVQNMRSDVTYQFSIVNLSKPGSLYGYGMKPVLYSTIEAENHFVGWIRVGSNIKYHQNEMPFEGDEGCSHTLTFTLNFPHSNDTVYLAHCYPYTYSDLEEDLIAIQSNALRSQFCTQRLLCKTLCGNNVYVLTITNPATEEVLKQKNVIILSSRVHPGETPSSWMLRGILHHLTSDSPVAVDLRDKFIFKIIPMLNPDGVIVGNTRCNMAARDLNRQYRSVIKEAFPPIFHTKNLIRKMMEDAEVVFYCDLHAHSRKFNVFMYGCENRRISTEYLREQVFPLMLHKNTAEKFSFDDCRFHVQREKESTGRVVVRKMGIVYSYTMEATYGGSNKGSRAYTHFSTDDYEGIGRYFCETLLDFFDPCPVKEELRNKIVGRLIRDGSNADDPANIALTDYSSLSSGCESSSDEEEANKGDANDSDEEAVKEREERKRIRKLRSRRDRCKNGAQFSQNLYADFRKSEQFEVKKSMSELAMMKVKGKKQPSKEALMKWAKNGKKKKIRRSLTIAALPMGLFKHHSGNSGSSNDLKVPGTMQSNNDDNNTEQKGTKFTIGSSDDDDSINNASDSDLENLFCPLTDSNGAPFDDGGDMNSEKIVSASNCRRVQDEIMASLSSFKTSILGRKGGLLHNYAMLEPNNPTNLGVTRERSPSQVSLEITPPTPSRGKSNLKKSVKSSGSLKKLNNSGTKSDNASSRHAIDISIPSPAGSSKSKKGSGIKKWDKYR